ncbi:MAG TPA: uroporphyrinogen decarboxylase family protein [Anaerolineaceae bacterium]|nr:uroporphyrinogen decarboxylase family protein [Anaerolineaceae bacterium]HPN50836.1 uroporphyrinogen decarboxylase family protein [Anaerolineaceae bacterium]
MTKSFTHRERLELTLHGEKTDRVPVSLWRHFPVDDQTPGGLAYATAHFQQMYDFDFIKVTPASSFCLKDWGVEDRWTGNTEGTREYQTRVIHHPDDWEKLPILDPKHGALADQITCLYMLFSEFDAETPVVQTIFNPLAQAKNLAGQETLLAHMRQYPEQVQTGLRRITDSTLLFLESVVRSGVAGIFFAVQHAQYHILSEAEYNTFGRPYDLEILDAARSLWLNILHMHGKNVMFDLLVDYPVPVINWHDRTSGPSLAQAQKRFLGTVCGGLRQWETLVTGNPLEVNDEALEAIQSTQNQHFILGTGCVVPVLAPHANIWAARQSVVPSIEVDEE